jgi:agmatinase
MLRYLRRITERVVSAGKLPVTLGGEHTVTLGPLAFLSEKSPKLTVLSLDAHTDLRDEYEGNRYSHASVMRRALEMCRVVEVGIRSTAKEEQRIIRERSVPIFTAEEALEDGALSEKLSSYFSDDVYVSIDLDVFDPGIMPSTGTPEPGGLGWYDILNVLRIVSEGNVVGFDVVELSPKPGNSGPDFLAARLMYKFLGYIFRNRR